MLASTTENGGGGGDGTDEVQAASTTVDRSRAIARTGIGDLMGIEKTPDGAAAAGRESTALDVEWP